mmetsp:Transcript_4665/g.5167  ORF Transcript_4665/g.5167 Transcript_4665/m.5167 type:complete len:137 (+) Transcript_4665:67-477(+)|eukprot:CAMPEP_0194132742 /NCGR_PEP_ID=MMETSP0152-20130528/3144_1 /TAXON_ID=1049557 /ORGANISM="Thalassiothrix antarctica, Strain L6-D1" /LENGTH=136 /DNA_ID=CAMNT_0038827901 /DNA_START=67 /DNA_END=477 /DNA_ORIENTATION=+
MIATMLRVIVLAVGLVTTTGFTTFSKNIETTKLFADRRAFLDSSITTGVIALLSVLPPPALAEDSAAEDLSMPSNEEQQKLDMEEKLRKKAELKKKIAKPNTVQESFNKEMDKQQSMKKTKEERRNALCEELGRGC